MNIVYGTDETSIYPIVVSHHLSTLLAIDVV